MGEKITKLSPVAFRSILISLMALLLALGVAGFYAAQSKLSDYAEEISSKVAEAESSKNSVERLKRLETELAQLSDARSRAKLILAESQSHRYQDEIIADLNRYASQSGVVISQINFQSNTPAAGGAATPAPAQSPGAKAAPRPSGASSSTVNVSLNPPIEYRNLLRFMRSIEQNLTKMQLSGISLAPGESGNTVSTDTLTIEVYIK